MAFLEIGGKRHALPVGEAIIGSDASAVITLTGEGIEPQHAVVRSHADGQVAIRKALESAEILINGVRLGPNPTPLLHGDVVTIGGHEIVFVDESQSGSTQYVQAVDPATLAGMAKSKKRAPTSGTGGRLVSLTDGREYTIGAVSFAIGRDATCDVVLTSKSVSRRHADIMVTPKGYVVVDGSTNGTLVNGKRVEGQQLLARGDVIQTGEHEFRFYADLAPADPQPVPAPPPSPPQARSGQAPSAPPPTPPQAAPGHPPAAPPPSPLPAVPGHAPAPAPAPAAPPPSPLQPALGHPPAAPPPGPPQVTPPEQSPPKPPPGPPQATPPQPSPPKPPPAASPAAHGPAAAPAGLPETPAAPPRSMPAAVPPRPVPPPGAEHRLSNTLHGIPNMPQPQAPPQAPPKAAPVPRPLAYVIVRSGALKGQRFPLRVPIVNVGRAEYNDVVLADFSVSTTHAKIQRREGIWMLVDLESTNGTLVDGERVTDEVPLAPGALIRFGDVPCVFEPTDDTIDAPKGSSTRMISAFNPSDLPNPPSGSSGSGDGASR